MSCSIRNWYVDDCKGSRISQVSLEQKSIWDAGEANLQVSLAKNIAPSHIYFTGTVPVCRWEHTGIDCTKIRAVVLASNAQLKTLSASPSSMARLVYDRFVNDNDSGLLGCWVLGEVSAPRTNCQLPNSIVARATPSIDCASLPA